METADPRVAEFEARDLGCDHAQYFPGVGTAFTRFDDVYVGVGESYAEALADAAEMLAQSVALTTDDHSTIDALLWGADATEDAHDDCTMCECEEEDCADCTDNGPHDACEWQHYAVIYVRYATGDPS